MKLFWVLNIMAIFLVACATATPAPTSTPAAVPAPTPTTVPLVSEPSVDSSQGSDPALVITTDSGLQYRDLVVGTGAEASVGATAVVHYTGWLMDGTKFDSSLDSGNPFSFSIGAGDVIKGWDEGVASMKVGSKRELTIPADLAYGDRGAGGRIPPGATLIFEVELLELR